MTHHARSSLAELAERVERGDSAPVTGPRPNSAADTDNFRPAAVLALFTPTAAELPTAEADHTRTPGHTRTAEHPSGPPGEPTAAAPPPPAPRLVGADLFLVQRSPLLRNHPGQIALPGGALEPGDAGPQAAAVRETEEETGIPPDRIEVLCELPSVMVPISSFEVTPVLGWAPSIPQVSATDQSEVLHTLRAPVDQLLSPDSRSTVVHGKFSSPGFWIQSGWIWGFTGILLDHLFTQLGWARPWDAARQYNMTRAEARGENLLQRHRQG